LEQRELVLSGVPLGLGARQCIQQARESPDPEEQHVVLASGGLFVAAVPPGAY